MHLIVDDQAAQNIYIYIIYIYEQFEFCKLANKVLLFHIILNSIYYISCIIFFNIMSNFGGKMYFTLYHIKPFAYYIGNIILNLALILLRSTQFVRLFLYFGSFSSINNDSE